MKQDIILSGVGGQGIVSIASVIGLAALEEGWYIKQSEVHGMSQRGGAVMSHLRFSDQPVASDLIPLGKADIILSAEPMESLRYLPYLAADGWVVTNSRPFVNIANYPDIEFILNEIEKLPKTMMADAEQLAEDAGSIKSSNMVMLGIASPVLSMSETALEKGIRQLFSNKSEDIIQMNLKAFQMGRSLGKSQMKN